MHQGPSSTGRDVTHLAGIPITPGLFFIPQQPPPWTWRGDIMGSVWRLRASCSLLPPWSALLLTEKQTAKYSNGLSARGGQGREEPSRAAGLSCQALQPVYKNTQGQEVLAPQPNTAWEVVQGRAATSVGMEWGELVRGSPSLEPTVPLFQLTKTFSPSQFPLKQHRGNPNRK